MFRIMQLVARTVRERRQIRPHSGGLEAGKSSHVTAEKCWRDSWTLSDFKVGYDLLLLTYPLRAAFQFLVNSYGEYLNSI